jgi:endonuclease III
VTKAEKAKKIAKILGELYPDPQVPLDHHDAFSLLVAVVLSAQTTDRKVNQVTPELFKAARSPHALSNLPVETIQSYIREVGLAP